MISTKQKRIFTTAILLSPGAPVPATTILNSVDCSVATLSRYLRDLRETYNVTIAYRKSTHSYQMTNAGDLTSVDIDQMKKSLGKTESHTDGVVNLSKAYKKSISISLSKQAFIKLDVAAKKKKVSRSEVIESLINTL